MKNFYLLVVVSTGCIFFRAFLRSLWISWNSSKFNSLHTILIRSFKYMYILNLTSTDVSIKRFFVIRFEADQHLQESNLRHSLQNLQLVQFFRKACPIVCISEFNLIPDNPFIVLRLQSIISCWNIFCLSFNIKSIISIG